MIGLERALTVWNDQLALLPRGLSRILGITVYLGIPVDLAGHAAAGAVLAGVGVLLSAGRARRTAGPAQAGATTRRSGGRDRA